MNIKGKDPFDEDATWEAEEILKNYSCLQALRT